MNIIEKYSEKIRGILTGFDRIIINGYSRQLNNCHQFLYYLIQNNCNLVDFNKFAEEHTSSLILILKNLLKNKIDQLNLLCHQKLVKMK